MSLPNALVLAVLRVTGWVGELVRYASTTLLSAVENMLPCRTVRFLACTGAKCTKHMIRHHAWLQCGRITKGSSHCHLRQQLGAALQTLEQTLE